MRSFLPLAGGVWEVHGTQNKVIHALPQFFFEKKWQKMAKKPFFHHFGCLRAALAACGPPGGPHMWGECILEAPCNRGQAHGPLDSCWVSKNSQTWAKTAKNRSPHTVWGAQQRHVWLLVGQTTTTHSFFETILIGVGIDEHLRSFWALGLAKNAQKCP